LHYKTGLNPALLRESPGMRDDVVMAAVGDDGERAWTLLTNHGRVLLLIARAPDVRIRDLAVAAGITERAVQMIVTDLEHAGYVVKERVGRRNAYTINRDQPFRHRAESDHLVGELIDLFSAPAPPASAAAPPAGGR
jgi:DNA-binding transcriptional ArsR family regulator